MYYKYFEEKTIGKTIKQIAADLLKSVIYAFILTFVIAFIFGFRPVYIVGDSMTPEILKHDLIIVRPVAADDIKAGDVITYTNGNGLTTHRVFGVENGIYFTKDEPTVLNWQKDGTTFEDVKSNCEEISFSQVKGRYVNRLVLMGDFVEYLTMNEGNKINIISVIEVGLTLAGFSLIIKIFQKAEDKYEARG